MSDFSYKPALLRSARHYTLGETHLICTDKNGAEEWRMAWGLITGAACVDHKIKTSQLRRLDLIGDVKHSISYTGGLGPTADDPEAVKHLDLMAAILSRLDPELPVAVVEYGRARLALFIVGLLSACAALGMLALAIGTGVSGDRLAAAAVPFGLLFVLGATFTWSNAPWRPVPKLAAGILAKVLTKVAHPEKDPET